ncbi:T9SS type A sorting domain-containing protein [Flavihumibacter fluvii]|uniref:T9SS type A sorting domain-containing protein n=1 Tax=Flavihumibacter fluvii TaxID=2838157 RepID=UPI001BDE0D37|nr:T9SS type A sorting domain-containing protein [Flavihumibacter fluvii]ULQ54496.1 T9SS type A sorting domain-containing protein [Flavihumibacter fluvii]
MAVILSIFIVPDLIAQPCSSLIISSVVPKESRCAATGTITVAVTGGSGNYNYKVTGPINTPFTTSAVISGLIAGTYTVIVQDVITNCTVQRASVVVAGSYVDPRFTVTKSDETCLNKSDGTISLSSLSGGRAPYTFTIVAPSPSGIGTSNNTGLFTGLTGGDYSIELKDSCGGIQTRRVTLLGYNWWIASYAGTRINCSDAQFQMQLQDSRGNVNTSGTTFDGFQYGVINAPGDTTWYSTYDFTHTIGTKRLVTVVVKDLCGNTKQVNWVNTITPRVANLVATTNESCNSFTATITGQVNLTDPTYCLYTEADALVSCNATGSFSGIAAGSYYITIQDLCFDTTIRRNFVLNQPKPSADATVSTTMVSCTSFNAAITGLVNFTNPDFCLFDAMGTQLVCNTTGAFNNLANGSYCINIKDGCYDTTVVRCFNVTTPIPSASANVTISDQQCLDFDVTITGQTNLFNADFCLYTSAGVLVSCNKTGDFTNIPYGAYCMRITADAACYDTTIERCFDVLPVRPNAGANLDVVKYCSTIDISAGGLSGFDSPQFCLYDNLNVLVSCNTTGVFTGLPYGTYCMDIRNNAVCFDTTIRRCITVVPDLPGIGSVQVSNQICSGFDIEVLGKTSLTNPQFILKNSAGVVIATNTTGSFTNIPYGSYCVDMQNDASCYDTLITRCFSASLPRPDAGAAQVSGRSCGGFTAAVTWINNFSSPTFSLLDVNGIVMATNTTGLFSNVPYGDYCIAIKDNCYDTTITRCLTGTPDPVNISATARASCELNKTNLRVSISTGQSPYTLRVYDHLDSLVATVTGTSSPLRAYDLPGLPPGQLYRAEVTDNCGNTDSKLVAPVLSTFSSSATMVAKCPSGTYQDGSSELTIVVSSNLGTIMPVIIKKDAVTVNILYNTSTTTIYKWIDLEPATYVVQYNLPGSCNNKAYDTIAVGPYQFPKLDKSASYQCDNNSFSVMANVTGGAPPFSYEIIGSVPAAPSIIAPPQASPLFNINNGNTYSLVRLRVVDYCGNATLNDVSVLPLQNMVISASSDCYYSSVLLTVDSIVGATYEWYFKTSATDSILISTSRVHEIPYMTPAEVGTYVSRISVNSGCLTRLSYYNVTGQCSPLLPGKLELAGKPISGKQFLNWNHLNAGEVMAYIVEKKQPGSDRFVTIGQVAVAKGAAPVQFAYTDEMPGNGAVEYRIKAVDRNGKVTYSNTILLNNRQTASLQVYPNPVEQVVNISLPANIRSDYSIRLFSASGQLMYSKELRGGISGIIAIKRKPSMLPGLYFLSIRNISGGTEQVEKLIFK